MARAGKRIKQAKELVEPGKFLALEEALSVLDSMPKAKFDESVDVAIQLGIDAKKSDQAVRGVVSLPHGTGKTQRVAVFCKGPKVKEAEDAGADVVGAEDLVEKVQGGWMEFDAVVATPDVMALVGKIGKLLGPRGLMPNPKLGTVTFDVGDAVKAIKAGQVEFRAEKAGIVHAGVGKASFGSEKLKENITALIDAVTKAKPQNAKGVYLQKISVSTTMSPGVALNPIPFRQ